MTAGEKTTARKKVPAWAVDTALVALAAFDVWWNLEDSADASVLVLVAGALASGALFLRRRLPLTTFALTLPACLVLDLQVVSAVALYTLAERSRDRRLLAACAIASAAASSVPWPRSDVAQVHETWVLVYFGYLLAVAAAPVLLGQLVQAHRDLSVRLDEIEEAREHERQLHAEAVVARERAQLAREMHDVVAHQVSLIAVRAGALQVVAPDSDTQEAARTIRSLSVGTLDELRHMVTLLRASTDAGTELTPQPTLADLRRLVADSAIQATLTGELPADITTTAQRTVYRTVQEALTNVRKHAPGATAAVQLFHHEHEFGVMVTNTKATRPPLPLPGSHQGLIGLTERAELLHGSFTAGPLSDGGYRVRLEIPTDAEAPFTRGTEPNRPDRE
ncbi:sensor histidine kinase [Embleya hyalina]|uniref:histidine kinase n=1 Tax=Embleya hyalina TaxID=516124 RepID=A0A401YN28_9ACTN|nr:sensor histidine kinase [Embleya hyalina]GCD96020.1 two-component sensor histidine kinase [Embleya hyalina]